MGVRVTDLDTKYQISTNLVKVLAAHEKTKKKKYLKICPEIIVTSHPLLYW